MRTTVGFDTETPATSGGQSADEKTANKVTKKTAKN
jgi:hypothetical protein